jgi:hypothetical protein
VRSLTSAGAKFFSLARPVTRVVGLEIPNVVGDQREHEPDAIGL